MFITITTEGHHNHLLFPLCFGLFPPYLVPQSVFYESSIYTIQYTIKIFTFLWFWDGTTFQAHWSGVSKSQFIPWNEDVKGMMKNIYTFLVLYDKPILNSWQSLPKSSPIQTSRSRRVYTVNVISLTSLASLTLSDLALEINFCGMKVTLLWFSMFYWFLTLIGRGFSMLLECGGCSSIIFFDFLIVHNEIGKVMKFRTPRPLFSWREGHLKKARADSVPLP